jgi:Rieske Fe-S protein
MDARFFSRRFCMKAFFSAVICALLPRSLFSDQPEGSTVSDTAGESGEKTVEETPPLATISITDKEHAALSEIGGACYVDIKDMKKPLIVCRLSERELSVFSSECTHRGCKVKLPNKKDLVVCPCHRAKYDRMGKRLKGPAKKDLTPYRGIIDGETVSIYPVA